MKTFDKTTPINIEDIVIEDEEKEEKKVPKKTKTSSEKEVKEEPKESIVDEEDDFLLEEIVKNDYQEATIVEMDIIESEKIGIASDHRGFNLKQKLTNYLIKLGYTVIDYGGDGLDGDDYPEFGFKLGEAISKHEVEKGIAICGSGIGISIACNKVKKVRCAKVNNVKETKWACNDNDANIIALSSKIPTFRAKDIVDVFLSTKFSGKERHQRRIDALNSYKG